MFDRARWLVVERLTRDEVDRFIDKDGRTLARLYPLQTNGGVILTGEGRSRSA